MKTDVPLKLICPACNQLLMDDAVKLDHEDGVKLKIKVGEETGTIWLSSQYGSYKQKSDLKLLPHEVAIFSCPNCEKEILSDGECDQCGAPMIYFSLDIGGKVSICTRNGCKGHFVEYKNVSHLLSNFAKLK